MSFDVGERAFCRVIAGHQIFIGFLHADENVVAHQQARVPGHVVHTHAGDIIEDAARVGEHLVRNDVGP
jgi:hypothetical protein